MGSQAPYTSSKYERDNSIESRQSTCLFLYQLKFGLLIGAQIYPPRNSIVRQSSAGRVVRHMFYLLAQSISRMSVITLRRLDNSQTSTAQPGGGGLLCHKRAGPGIIKTLPSYNLALPPDILKRKLHNSEGDSF